MEPTSLGLDKIVSVYGPLGLGWVFFIITFMRLLKVYETLTVRVVTVVEQLNSRLEAINRDIAALEKAGPH